MDTKTIKFVCSSCGEDRNIEYRYISDAPERAMQIIRVYCLSCVPKKMGKDITIAKHATIGNGVCVQNVAKVISTP
tara:strand:+ start:153 stop:380 length:228 start_codon:yes stop_codon:yes gene_type:complete